MRATPEGAAALTFYTPLITAIMGPEYLNGMPSQPRLPVTSLSSRRGTIELVDEPRKPPPAPRTLDKRERELWRLFSDPIADLWSAGDRRLVVRLIGPLVRLEREGASAPGWVYALTQSLEDRLTLNPRARRAAGVVFVAPPLAPLRVRRIDAHRRERIARGG